MPTEKAINELRETASALAGALSQVAYYGSRANYIAARIGWQRPVVAASVLATANTLRDKIAAWLVAHEDAARDAPEEPTA